MPISKASLLFISVMFCSAFCTDVVASVNAKYWAIWDASNESNLNIIDHGSFDQLLNSYVIANHPSGINRFRYADVSTRDKKKLKRYISRMAKTDPRLYSRVEQKAYWLNLYNALTIQTVLQKYPVSSLAKASIKRKNRIKVAGTKLSLADIENRILRPIWRDRKILFGLSCGTMGCPNIQQQAFTGANTKQLLNRSVREFINHPRGMIVDRRQLQASEIFDWYAADFGSDKKMIKFFTHYAEDTKALYLLGFNGAIAYSSDARLNAPETSWPQ